MNLQSRVFSAFLAGMAAFLFADVSAWAQGGGGGGGRGEWRNRRAEWADSFEAGKSRADSKERYLLLYICKQEEEDPPNSFNSEDARKASRNSWVFVREHFERDDPICEEYHVKRAPTLIGMDQYGNDFGRTTRISSGDIKNLMKSVEKEVSLFKRKLQAEYSRGRSALRQKKESKVLESYSKILKMKKPGYPEVEKADAWVVEYAGREQERINALPDLPARLKGMDLLADQCEGASIEGQIYIGLARMEHDAGKIRDALKRLDTVGKKLPRKQAEEVRKERNALISFGLQKIEALLALCDVGEKAEAKEGLKMLREDYKGTEVSNQAADALKSIR